MKSEADPRRCPMCRSDSNQRTLIPRFPGRSHGHVFCSECGASYDDNLHEVRRTRISAESIQAIASRAEHQDLFVETWKIANEEGEVYPNFDWEDNEDVQRGVTGHFIRTIERFLDPAPSRILDVGCGNGFTTRILAERYGTSALTGVDPSPLVEAAGKRFGFRGLRGTLDTIEFEEGSYDVVLIAGNLMLHPCPQDTIETARRALRPGGLVVFDFKNNRALARRLARQIAWRVPRAAESPLVQRNFLNMRFGLHRGHLEQLAPETGWKVREVISKPPRLLEFANQSLHSRGLKGAVWRATDLADRLLGERAWIQVAAEKR